MNLVSPVGPFDFVPIMQALRSKLISRLTGMADNRQFSSTFTDRTIQYKADVFKGMSIAVKSQRVKTSIPGVPGSKITNSRFPGKNFTFPDFPSYFPGTKTIPEIPGNIASIPGIPRIPGASYHPHYLLHPHIPHPIIIGGDVKSQKLYHKLRISANVAK